MRRNSEQCSSLSVRPHKSGLPNRKSKPRRFESNRIGIDKTRPLKSGRVQYGQLLIGDTNSHINPLNKTMPFYAQSTAELNKAIRAVKDG
jgi:hypothetical protein